MPPRPPLNFFVAYDQADANLQKELLNHLASWERQGTITIWSWDQITVGQEIDGETISYLEQADVVLLLLSARYLASHQYDIVVPRALEQQRAGKTRLIPILLYPVDLTDTPLDSLKLLPSNAQSVIDWPHRDSAFLDILQALRKVVEQLNGPSTEVRSPLDKGKLGKETRLKSMQIDQYDFVQDRLQRFVGREAELTELQKRIAKQMESGGYVTITGTAGQGKSSIIAKMIERQGIDITAYHFIQYNSGPGHQESILRNLMARLILKYDLPERYMAGESYPILRDYFRRVLQDIAQKGVQEEIYIDGLDQLAMNQSATRDVSFLPLSLPPGIVIVLGTRPDRTLQQLEPLAKNDLYRLPGLSREDFDLLLEHHKVPLAPALSDSLYRNLKRNVLYLDLVARELQQRHGRRSEEIIARVANNPDSIFTITFSRMQELPGWYDVIRPILGTLLVAQEPLTAQQIAHIIKQENVRVRAGVKDLGGLLTGLDQERHTLFHPKLKEYLQPDANTSVNDIQFDAEEVQIQHGKLAEWCGQGTIEQLWRELPNPAPRDDYREYAQKHYITHLYHARRRDEQLFAILNDGDYERGKLRFDRSTRSSAVDLMLGSQAAARKAATLAEGKVLLTYLWRYTLLRTNLTTQADAYPVEAFQALLALGRENVAFDLVELLTQPAKKLAVLTLLTEYLFKQPAHEEEGEQLYIRVYEIATSIEDSDIQTMALNALATVLIGAGQLRRAEGVAGLITDDDKKAKALNDVIDAYGSQKNWYQAEEVAHAIDVSEERVKALSNLAAKRKLANEEEQAERLWQEASTIAFAITDNDQRSRAIYHQAISFIRAKEWEKAEIATRSIASNNETVNALCQLALAFTQEGLATRAEMAWDEALTIARSITETDKPDTAYKSYAIAQVQAGLWNEAKTIARRRITSPTERIAVFSDLAANLVREGLWEQSKSTIDLIAQEYDLIDVSPLILDKTLIRISIALAQRGQWEQARETALAIPKKEARCRALMEIVSAMAGAGLSETAQIRWEEARAMCTAQMDAVETSVAGTLVSVMVEAGQLEQAKKIIPTLLDKQRREDIMEVAGGALARTGQLAEAEKIANEVTHPRKKVNIQKAIAVAHMQAGETELAIETASTILDENMLSNVLSELAMTCCQMEQWDIAKEIAQQIQSIDKQASTISSIAAKLVWAGKVKDAEAITRSISNEFLKANAMCDLATTLAQAGYIPVADRLARSIKKNSRIRQKALTNISMVGLLGTSLAEYTARAIDDGSEREAALCNVVIAYAREHSWDEAERIAGEMSDEQKRDEAWGVMARELARTEQWPHAVAILDKIQKSDQRIAVLQAWGKPLAELASNETRAQVVQHLNQSKEKASLLVSMANALAEGDDYIELIHLTQQAWLQASTKDDCQYLFAMVRDLLLSNTELCNEFYDSFRWVDTFFTSPFAVGTESLRPRDLQQ
jgi:tetratricopeptide (TPR) repeat protein